jgi:hypothetical protein
MDDQRFDQLARAFASAVPRRRVLGMLAGGVSAAILRIKQASAGCATVCESDIDCCPGQTCLAGMCIGGEICATEGLPCIAPAGTIPTICCPGLECVAGICMAPPPVCVAEGESCIVPVGDLPSICCEGLECIEGVCSTPCSTDTCEVDADCCEGLVCSGGTCSPPVLCAEEGLACAADADCCEGLVCVEGVCAPPETCVADGDACAADADCCEGICCAGACRAIECCIDDPNPNDRCNDGETCFEGVCEGVSNLCDSDSDCATGTCCCADGSCSADCCEIQLPNTGSGLGGDRSASWLGAGLAAAAAAYLGGRKLRPGNDPVRSNE